MSVSKREFFQIWRKGDEAKNNNNCGKNMVDNNERNISNGIVLQVVDLPTNNNEEIKEVALPAEKTKKTHKWKKGTKATRRYFPMFMAELVGTAMLMLFGCMGCIKQVDNPPAVHHMSSISFGMVILLIIQSFGHISGAHLCPAVTIASVILKMITPAMGVVYVIGQLLGAIMGFALLKALIPSEWAGPGFCATQPHELVTTMQAFIIETLITCALILVCCGVWDKKNEAKQDSTPIRFGFIIVAISMVAGPLTGASMNTARSLAPAILEGNYTNLWIYVLAPNIGAIVGCGMYTYLFNLKEEDGEIDESSYLRCSTTNEATKM